MAPPVIPSTTTTTVVELPAETTEHISGDGTTYVRETDSFSAQVGVFVGDTLTIQSYAAYEWDFTNNELEGTFDFFSLTSASIIVYHSQADLPRAVEEVEIVSIASGINALSNAALWANINTSTTIINTVTLSGDAKTQTTIAFDNAAVLTTLQTAVTGATAFAIGIRRKTTSSDGQALLGGLTMARGTETAWEATSATNVADAPGLVVTGLRAVDDHPLHFLRYTSAADPSINQSTPSASLGGYMAPNVVSIRAQLADNISSKQTTATILSTSSLPSDSSGLVAIGSEIMSYGSLDSTNNKLTNISRAVVPPISYAAITEPFPEFVHYLSVTGLFDTKPTFSLVQYRCVAIQQQSDTDALWETTFPELILTQNPNTDVRVDIGIEVPKFDVHTGTFFATVAGNEFTSDTATGGSNLGVTNFADGFFNGGHLIIDPDGDALNHIIDSYEFDSTTGLATFFLEDNFVEQSSGTAFRINPAPSQIVQNEITPPDQNSGLFRGFFGDGATKKIVLEEHDTVMFNFDIFYIWIKRTFLENKRSSNDTGAIITILSERVQ